MVNEKILVVEDEELIGQDIKILLEDLGYEVPYLVPSGEEAISRAGEIRADLVLMDIMLKGEKDGIEAAREIKKQLKIPVLYLTAYTDDETLARAKTTEPAGYISKPFKEEDLHINIEMALHKQRIERKENDNIN